MPIEPIRLTSARPQSAFSRVVARIGHQMARIVETGKVAYFGGHDHGNDVLEMTILGGSCAGA